MSVIDNAWNQMLEIAKSQQQEYHELLCDWTKYLKHEYKYLRQNIGFAIFGPPTVNENANVILKDDEISSDSDLINIFRYSSDAEKLIDIIFEKVCEFGEGCIGKDSIYYGLIYNITFRIKDSSSSESGSKENKKEEKDEESEIRLMSMPIFKIRRPENETWYIDTSGRVYKKWTDYKENNTLPQCTMVLPKNGFYEPDPDWESTEEYSVVFLEVLDSPACGTIATVCRGIDIASNVVGAVGVGLCVATFFTPLAPIAIGATAATGINGVWSIGRSVHNLVDRSCHEESISITDRNALGSWLAIGGCTLGMVASGGNVLLTRVAQGGGTVGTATRVAYNALILSNLGINSIGIAYQAYCLYEKYNQEGKVHIVDVAFLATHILFLGNAVMNLQFAGEIIESTQGRILDDYRATLRSKNMRKKFNRAKRNAAQNNPDKISENAEVIRYINKKVDLGVKLNAGNISTQESNVFFENGKLIINGIALMDPMKFVDILINFDSNSSNRRNSEGNNDSGSAASKLKDLLLSLLKDLFKDDKKSKHVPDAAEFNNTIEDMKNMKNALSIFVLVFKIASRLITEDSSCSEYLAEAVEFIWRYAKESLRQSTLKTCCLNNAQIEKCLNQIITALFEYMDAMVKELLPAFEKYISKCLGKKFA